MEVYSVRRFADALENNMFSDGQRRTLTGTADDSVLVNVTDLSFQEKVLARAAWKEISTVTGLRFVETTGAADITYNNNGAGTANTSVSYSGNSIIKATVSISSDRVGSGDGIGSYAFRTYLHETAHAFGLGHPQDYDVVNSFSESKIANDSWQMSIMSYFDQDENTWVNASYARQITLMIADYVALRGMYGSPPVRSGDTAYGVNSTAGGALDKIVSLGAMATFLIADTGGSDKINLSAFSAGQLIDLRPGAISSVMGAVGNMQISTDTIIETAIGGSGRDRLIGNAANNSLDGRGGGDRMEGGRGNDTYYCTAGDVIAEGASAGTDRMLSSGNLVLAANIENGQVLGFAAVSITGNGLANRIIGNAAANVLKGGGGTDTLIGGAGNDVYVTNGGDRIIEAANAGIDRVQSSVSHVLGANLENLVLTGAVAMKGTGNALANSITGNAAANILNGGAGKDTLAGGAGNDVYIIEGLDVITEAANAGVDRVESSKAFTLGGNLENLTLTGTAIYGTGNELSNRLIGNASNNVLSGGTGNDTLTGGAGNDTLDGGTGANTVVYGGTAAVSVNLTNGTGTGGQGSDTLTKISNAITGGGNDILVGNNSVNRLNGGAGNDTISGEGGIDFIAGGAGADLMRGGAGDRVLDTFLFNALTDSSVGAARDVIEDFVSGIDRLNLAAIDANATTAGDQSFLFNGTAAMAQAVWYVGTADGIVVRADVNGNTTADFEVLLRGVTTLTGNDFLL